jgi:hypothetical protein
VLREVGVRLPRIPFELVAHPTNLHAGGWYEKSPLQGSAVTARRTGQRIAGIEQVETIVGANCTTTSNDR